MDAPVEEAQCAYDGVAEVSGETTTTAAASTGISTTHATDDAVDSSSGPPPQACGNGALDPKEECDGAVPQGASCTDMGFGEGTLACADDCTLDYSECPGYVECGNGEIGVDEECDGKNLGGATCDDFPNATGPGLVCTDQCTLDPGACLACAENGDPCTSGQTVCCDPGAICGGVMPNCCLPGSGGCLIGAP